MSSNSSQAADSSGSESTREETIEVPPQCAREIECSLAEAHEAWAIDVEVISGQTVIEAERENYHTNGGSTGVVALDHPQESGWEVLGATPRRDRWSGHYEDGASAAETLATLTQIYEARRTIKHERPTSPATRAYYHVESLLLDELER